jgi:hypothetical protein
MERTMQREPKTWGPFNGRQLTTIVCVIAAVTLVPVGAWAKVTFTNVAITDPGGVNRAKVDATGKIAVGDGVGPLTVDGAVSVAGLLPAKPIVVQVTPIFASFTNLWGPKTTRFGISSLTVENASSQSEGTLLLYSRQAPGSDFEIFEAQIPPHTTSHFTFPDRLVSSPPVGGTISVGAVASGGALYVSATGIQS